MILAVAFLAMPFSVWANDGSAEPELHVDDRISYAIGYDITNRLKNSFDINPDLFVKGMKDSLAETPAMTQEKMQKTLMEFQAMVQQKQMEAQGKKWRKTKQPVKHFWRRTKPKKG